MLNSSISFAVHTGAQARWEGLHRSLSFIQFIATDNILPGLAGCFKLISYIVINCVFKLYCNCLHQIQYSVIFSPFLQWILIAFKINSKYRIQGFP